ncbi:MAG: DNA-binding protein WhiA, partial [Oscillospiraceae bacterium]
ASALHIMNLKVYKDFRNRANRVTNCETANIDKTVAANRKVLNAIDFLEKQGALDTLDPALRQAAQLRRENPEFSLAELAAASEAPVSKSGLSHRFRKICEKADTLREQPKSV